MIDPRVYGFVAGIWLGITVHEAGHLVCARAVSFRVRRFCVGVGPLLYSFRTNDSSFEFRLLPLAGFVEPYPSLWSPLPSRCLFILGGVLANLIFFFVLISPEEVGQIPRTARDILDVMASMQLLVILLTLIPMPARIAGRRTWTDGGQLLRLLFRLQKSETPLATAYSSLLRAYDPRVGEEALRSPLALDVSLTLCQPGGWANVDAWRRKRAAMSALLSGADLRPWEEMPLLDGLITGSLLFDNDETNECLDAWSQRAMLLGPDVGTLKESRGGVLVQLRRFAEGKALLAPHAPDHARSVPLFFNQLFMAEAEHGLGEPEAARYWLSAAMLQAEALASTSEGPVVMARWRRAEAFILSMPGGVA